MLVSDSQLNVTNGKSDKIKTPLWSRIIDAFANGMEMESDKNSNPLGKGDIYLPMSTKVFNRK